MRWCTRYGLFVITRLRLFGLSVIYHQIRLYILVLTPAITKSSKAPTAMLRYLSQGGGGYGSSARKV